MKKHCQVRFCLVCNNADFDDIKSYNLKLRPINYIINQRCAFDIEPEARKNALHLQLASEKFSGGTFQRKSFKI